MTVRHFQIEPFFLDGPNGSLFCVHTVPEHPRGTVLYLPPFGEEMHKSRRMAALQARALAAHGYAVLQPDLTGCGDSGGDFANASWSGWIADATAAYQWLVGAHGQPAVLWGLRTGALLAANLARRVTAARLVLWQPVVDGGVFLNQFLRIRLAAEMLADNQATNGMGRLRDQLEAGTCVEVGGYLLSPTLARELEQLKLAALAPPCPVIWLETTREAELSPASRRVVDAWTRQGVQVEAATLAGDAFWSTQEISVCPALIDATLAQLEHERVALA